MVRMKHLLRKLHIGGGGAAAAGISDHHSPPLDDLRNNNLPPIPSSSSSSSSSVSSASASASSSLRGRAATGQGFRSASSYSASTSSSSPSLSSSPSPSTRGRAAGDGSVGSRTPGSRPEAPGAAPGDFSFFEEEYQVQLALAISVSDPDGREDPESAQINAAKRMSLGCTPMAPVGVGGSESLMEFLSQRYWNYNILNYDEKVMDGFYDVYGIIRNPNLQAKMPLLVDLQSASISDSIDYEVVLVNRTTDVALQQLERQAVSISLQCRAAEPGPFDSGLIQKIADLVVNSMGGPVGDADDMLRRWTAKSLELRTALNTIVLPLGRLEVGLSRHRALLFKVLADRIDVPCRLVKGSYYTGTDDGAVNLIKIDHEREFIIDLMGAPGALIPAEIPSCHLQNAEFDLVNSRSITQTVKDLSVALGSNTNWQFDGRTGRPDRRSVGPNSSTTSVDSPAVREGPSGDRVDANIAKRNDTERFEHEFGKLLPSLTGARANACGNNEAESSARQMKVNDVSKYVVSAAKNPEFAQKLHAVLLESGASPPPDLFSDINSSDGQGVGMKEQSKMHPESHGDHSLFPFSELDSSIRGGENSKQKHYTEEMAQKQQEESDLNVLGIQSAAATRNEGLMLLDVGVNEMIQENYRASDPVPGVAMKSRGLYGPQEVGSSHQELIRAISGSGAQCLGPVAGRILKNVEMEEGNLLKESKETSDDAMSRSKGIANDNSYIANQVLDDVAEWEIPWHDLQIGERIGLGSYGEVYRADWNGTEVAVKKFLDQDLSGDALEQFRCEVEIMLRLRHPNVVLFMGAVTRPPNLSILTEFLPRGSLYRLLHRPNIQIDEKRRLRMALDVAKGMNYLHTSHPTIVHRDLKSPNLLVDKNWVVKVCDFGLSRLKLHTFLSSKSTAGTPEWMAPEVLRNELSNEKSDVYSFGVILWELATLRMPWSGMNPMQVVGAVGFQNRRLDIPKEVDPMVAEIICNCWHSEPNQRPSFQQLMAPLKQLQRLVVENP